MNAAVSKRFLKTIGGRGRRHHSVTNGFYRYSMTGPKNHIHSASLNPGQALLDGAQRTEIVPINPDSTAEQPVRDGQALLKKLQADPWRIKVIKQGPYNITLEITDRGLRPDNPDAQKTFKFYQDGFAGLATTAVFQNAAALPGLAVGRSSDPRGTVLVFCDIDENDKAVADLKEKIALVSQIHGQHIPLEKAIFTIANPVVLLARFLHDNKVANKEIARYRLKPERDVF